MTLLTALLLLFSATFSNWSVGAGQGDWTAIHYPFHGQIQLHQASDLAFGARASPLTGENLTSTGNVFAQTVGLRALRGAETQRASFDFAADLVATKGVATEAEVAANFRQNRQFWSSDPIEFNGNRVYQRKDLIDPTRMDPVSGKTNLELMQSGRAPIGPDGKPVNLHHLTQSQNGAIAEVTQTLHSENHGTLHMPNTVPSGIDRSQFNTWRRNYWINRANDF